MIKKRRGRFVVFMFLAVFWIIWVEMLNGKLVKEKDPVFVKKYENIGEWVPCGNNYYGKTYMNGWEIQVKTVKAYKQEEYLQRLKEIGYQENAQPDTYGDTGQVYEIEIGIKNAGNQEEKIRFLPIWLVGRDFYATPKTGWLCAINGFEENSIGVQLAQDEETTLRIPYSFTTNMYREKRGRRLKDEKLWLWLTAYPEQVLARVQ